MEKDVCAAGRTVQRPGWEGGFGHALHPSATKLPNPVDRYECEDRRVCTYIYTNAMKGVHCGV